MEWHRKLVKSLPSHSSQLEKAKANYQLVKAIYIPQNDIASAISQLNRILALLEHDEHHVDEKKDHQDHPTITDNFQFRLELLQMKATLEVQRCNWNAALSDYQDILQLMEHESQEENATTSPDVLAKHYYMMGRICVKLSKYEEALRYFSRELNITQEVVGACSLAVSRILHELAAIYENGLGDNEKALERYQEALRIEELVVKECHKASHKSTLSSSPPRRNKSSTCKNRLQEALHQRRETQRCIGRIHFKRGDFDRALQTSLIGSVGLPK
jgi:tetratricopeptide (TPR) repeat protein